MVHYSYTEVMNSEPFQLLPPMSTSEYDLLKEDIRVNGVVYPVIVDEEGTIIDGHHRAQICRELEIDCPVIVRKFGSIEEKQAVAIGLNLKRRQLSPEQAELMRQKMKDLVKTLRTQGKTQFDVAELTGIPRGTIARWEAGDEEMKVKDLRLSIPKTEYSLIASRLENGEDPKQIAADYKVTPERVRQVATLFRTSQRVPEPVGDIPMPQGYYKAIVIDPPWPMDKIGREVAPNQGIKLDYPVMSLEDIAKVPVGELADPSGCHLYLWVTHKFLPAGLELLKTWGFNYHCLMTWVKPSGFTPYSWMYNTEHVLFASNTWFRPNRLGLKLSFEAPVVRHSQKPDVFYDLIREASPEPRLELFARTPRDGFVVWGNEVPTI